jgi:glycosyltransferase involved in cell wall biosynthesis
MRILMLDNEFPPLGGGTGVVNYHLLAELAAHESIWVDLVTSSRSRRDYETESFADQITIYKVPVGNRNIHHSTNRELIRYSWRALHLTRKLLDRNSYELSFAFAGVPAGAISYALKAIAGLPYLVSLQGPDVPGFEARYNYLYPVLKPFLRRIWGNAAAVTAISQEHQRLANETMPQLEIPIIYNGVDLDAFQPADEPRQGPEVEILCVGRLIERKGQHLLLQAFSRLRRDSACPVSLKLVGTGDAEDSLRSLAADLDVADAVNFTGFVSRADMPNVYRQADIFALPSQNEGMSIALLEAMASGLPVVVTDTGGTLELVQQGTNGFVVSWADVSALTTVLARLVQDGQTRHQYGIESRRTAIRFAWSAAAKEYVELCAQIADGHIQH